MRSISKSNNDVAKHDVNNDIMSKDIFSIIHLEGEETLKSANLKGRKEKASLLDAQVTNP
ncbi:hypothetical protein NQZ68_004295 [Dissostichus eleginoides]|nr:hypothetical protein NQZ68_004295 [Dissostichus eleginoides]